MQDKVGRDGGKAGREGERERGREGVEREKAQVGGLEDLCFAIFKAGGCIQFPACRHIQDPARLPAVNHNSGNQTSSASSSVGTHSCKVLRRFELLRRPV